MDSRRFDDQRAAVGVHELGAGVEAMRVVGDPHDVDVAAGPVGFADLSC